MKKRKCATKGCRGKSVNGRYCAKCVKRKYRAKYPLKYMFDSLKTNARRRGKEFTLTLTEFTEFCKKTGYDEKKGREASCLSVDRIKDHEGYHAWNIQAITVSDNSKKKQIDSTLSPDEICPFDD